MEENNRQFAVLYGIGSSNCSGYKGEVMVVGKRGQRKAQERAMMVGTVHMVPAVIKAAGMYRVRVVCKYMDELFGGGSKEQQDS